MHLLLIYTWACGHYLLLICLLLLFLLTMSPGSLMAVLQDGRSGPWKTSSCFTSYFYGHFKALWRAINEKQPLICEWSMVSLYHSRCSMQFIPLLPGVDKLGKLLYQLGKGKQKFPSSSHLATSPGCHDSSSTIVAVQQSVFSIAP